MQEDNRRLSTGSGNRVFAKVLAEELSLRVKSGVEYEKCRVREGGKIPTQVAENVEGVRKRCRIEFSANKLRLKLHEGAERVV